MPEVSIIVPIYNLEKYLDECVQSLLKQTYRGIEIVLVDDGSTDRCGEMCDAYAINDERIKVIHQKNQGVSVARNQGMAIARGEFITFVDPDDWVEANMIEELISYAVKYNSDICLCRGLSFNKVEEKPLTDSIPDGYTLTQDDISNLYATNLLFLHGKRIPEIAMVSHKLYRNSILIENNIKFPVGMKRHQDGIFNLYAFQYAKIIVLRDLPLYHYRVFSNISARKGFLDNYLWMRGKRYIDETIIFVEQFDRVEIKELIVLYSIIRTLNFGAVQCFASKLSWSHSIRYIKEAATHEPYVSAIKVIRLKDLPFEDMVPVILLRLRLYSIYRLIAKVVMKIRRGTFEKHGF